MDKDVGDAAVAHGEITKQPAGYLQVLVNCPGELRHHEPVAAVLGTVQGGEQPVPDVDQVHQQRLLLGAPELVEIDAEFRTGDQLGA